MKDFACASRPSSLRTCTQVSSPWTRGCALSVCFSASYSRSKCRSAARITQLPRAPRLMLMLARASACSSRYKGVPSTYLLASTSASVDGAAMLPGKGCAGIGAVTIGVCRADSSGRRNARAERTQHLVERLGGCSPVERLARPCIQGGGDGLEVFVGVHTQVGALRKVLPQQPVRVLVRAPLPWAVRITEVDLHAGVDAQTGMLAQFG